jgi:hypothetical protein
MKQAAIMKWMEVVRVLRSPKRDAIETARLTEFLRVRLDEFRRDSSLCGYAVLEGSAYEFDLAVLLFWEGQGPRRSGEALEIKEFFMTLGLADHTVWKNRLHYFTNLRETKQ